jgi:uncharacterized repeat protein (TIGR02543 family)
MQHIFSFRNRIVKSFVFVAFFTFILNSALQAQTDLARGKVANASSEEVYSGITYYARLAFDGILTGSSRWSSNYSDPQWLRVDLGATYSVNRIVLRWEVASARDYIVEISTDGVTYSPLFSRANQATGARVDDVTCNGSGRYIRMTGTYRTTIYGYSLWALEVYGPNQYNLTTAVNPANSGTVSLTPAGGTYNQGTLVNLSATAATGYSFLNWTGGVTGTTANTSVTMNSNITATANFVRQTFTITPASGTNGTISPSAVQTINHGENSTFTFTPNAGYRIADVLVDGVSRGAITSHTFLNVTANHTISVSFAQLTYTLTTAINPSNSGTISLTPPPIGGVYTHGTNVAVTATQLLGYTFSNWTGDFPSTSPTLNITMTGNRNITANFTPNSYTITPTAGANGSISPSSIQTVSYGNSQTFTFLPATGYSVSEVRVDGVAVQPVTSYTFYNVNANHTISVAFAQLPTYTMNVTVLPISAGTVIRNPAGPNYPAGTSVTITANATAGYVFNNWSGDATGNQTSTTVIMNSNRNVTANFNTSTFTITPSSGPNGSITPSTVQSVVYGGAQTFAMTPNAGYRIADVLVNGTSVGALPSYTFNNVSSNQTINVSFTLQGAVDNIDKLSISGELFDNNGQPLGSPTAVNVNMTIELFNVITGGTALYTETFTTARNNSISVSNGFFTARLGEGTSAGSLHTIIRANNNLWAQITVDNGTPDVLSPRTPLTSSAYSFKATGSNVLNGIGDPNIGNVLAPVGNYYIDNTTGITWIRTNRNWLMLN